jgi:phosphatidate cytidylyltransferase
VTDRDDEERSQATPAEGVRILGAAQAVLGAQERRSARPATTAPPAAGDDDAIDLAEAAGGGDADLEDVTAEAEPNVEVPPLPHWTEPPTGAVPAIFADDDDDNNGDDLDAWATITGSQPRFRAEGSDWADADFADDLGASRDEERLGALSEEGPVDEEAEFAEALAARRRRVPRGRPARTMTTRPPARSRPEPEPELVAAPGRDLPAAIITGAAIAVAALICFRLGEAWTAAFVSLIVGLGTLEFANALRHKGFRPATLLALIGGLTFPLAAQHYGTGAFPVYLAIMVVFSMLWFLWEVTPGRPLLGIATTVLSFAYVGGLGGFAGLLLTSNDGTGLVLGVAICVVAYDVVGYFVGSQFGHSRIAPSISPNKTIEGTVAGMAAAVMFGWLVVSRIHPWSSGKGAALGLAVAIGAFLGDLCESMIKRDLGVKDFGSMLPGHGGALDRFDGMLFCLPIAYYVAVGFKLL